MKHRQGEDVGFIEAGTPYYEKYCELEYTFVHSNRFREINW